MWELPVRKERKPRVKPRDRLRLALNHQEADRVPIDLGGTICSSIHRDSYIALRKHLGLEVETLQMVDHIQQLPYLDETLLEQLGADVRMVQLPAATAPDVAIVEEGEYYALTDRWGSKLHMPKDGGLYFDWVEFPIKRATMEALDQYAWPRPDPPQALVELRRQAQTLYERTDYALVGNAIIGGGIFEQPARVMGLESFLVALVQEPRFADRLMEQITDIYIESCNNYLDQVGEYLDVFCYWDDLAGQDGWLISPQVYRKMIQPKQRRLVEAMKRKTDAKIYYHCCGAVSDVIPDLIDVGFDILNPVQVSARGMDTRRLKAEYGRDITFWGGGVDTQRVLPFGTPSEVADEVKRRIDDLAPGGGFVFAAVHNIQALVPPENIIAAFEAALEYGQY